jgi:NADH-quinone oxidoreductase subunit E
MRRKMDAERIDQIVDNYDGRDSYLIQILLDIQRENHWLPRGTLEQVSRRLGVPIARVMHIATFYKAFSLVPRGRHQLHVCTGTACHVRGAGRVLDKLEELTGIGPGETDPDLNYSLETVNCLGCCALGPVLEIDGRIFGKLSTSATEAALKSCEAD